MSAVSATPSIISPVAPHRLQPLYAKSQAFYTPRLAQWMSEPEAQPAETAASDRNSIFHLMRSNGGPGIVGAVPHIDASGIDVLNVIGGTPSTLPDDQERAGSPGWYTRMRGEHWFVVIAEVTVSGRDVAVLCPITSNDCVERNSRTRLSFEMPKDLFRDSVANKGKSTHICGSATCATDSRKIFDHSQLFFIPVVKLARFHRGAMVDAAGIDLIRRELEVPLDVATKAFKVAASGVVPVPRHPVIAAVPPAAPRPSAWSRSPPLPPPASAAVRCTARLPQHEQHPTTPERRVATYQSVASWRG